MTELFNKWAFYRRRYGAIHSLASFGGRKTPALWRLIGPAATRNYRQRWVSKPGPHILNLGGGGNIRPEWLTADIDPRADVYVDLTRKLPFADSIIDAIMLEEVLEHLPLPSALSLLAECRRILRPGGVLRITTPDFDWLSEMRNNEETFLSDRFLSGASRPSVSENTPIKIKRLAALNSMFYEHGHRFIYDREGLAELISHRGFTNIRQSSYRDKASRLGHLDDHAHRFGHSPELSMYLECEAP